MRILKFLTGLALLGITEFSFAQSSFHRRTLQVGAGVSTLNSDGGWSSPQPDYFFGLGFSRGGQALGFGLDLNLAWRRFIEPADVLGMFDSSSMSVRMIRFEIPFYLRFKITQSSSFKLGAFYSKSLGDLGRNFGGSGFSYSDSSYASENWLTSDYGLILGWMWHFNKFNIDLRYTWGAKDIYEDHPGTQYSRFIDLVFSYGF